MTDAFQVPGAPALSESIGTDSYPSISVADAAQAEPNGFELLGLAPELIRAVADLGYTQPTTVQQKTIPKALPGAGQAR